MSQDSDAEKKAGGGKEADSAAEPTVLPDEEPEDETLVKPEPEPEPEPDIDIGTKIRFKNKFFRSVDGAYFRLGGHDDGPVMMIKLGDEDVSLPFRGIRSEFNIKPQTHDFLMMEAVAEGLLYMKVLKIGDPIPKEVLTGEPSWEISVNHRERAYQRLTLQMVTWLTGDETLITNPDELLNMVENPDIKAKVNNAFDQAADSLGIKRENKEEVVTMIGGLADELAHIEALRETYERIRTLNRKLEEFRVLYGNDKSVLDLVDPVSRLMNVAVDGFRQTFDELDANTAEIISVLKNLGTHIPIIHKTRNDLFRRFLCWEDILPRWESARAGRSRAHEELLRDTYQFLAPRFMQADEWLLSTQTAGQTTHNAGMAW